MQTRKNIPNAVLPESGSSLHNLIQEAKHYWVHPEMAIQTLIALQKREGMDAALQTLATKPKTLGERTTMRFTPQSAHRMTTLFREYISGAPELKTAATSSNTSDNKINEAMRWPAYHYLYMGLQQTYRDPDQSFQRLEQQYRRKKLGDVVSKPELLGKRRTSGWMDYFRRNKHRAQVADIVHRFERYMKEKS